MPYVISEELVIPHDTFIVRIRFSLWHLRMSKINYLFHVNLFINKNWMQVLQLISIVVDIHTYIYISMALDLFSSLFLTEWGRTYTEDSSTILLKRSPLCWSRNSGCFWSLKFAYYLVQMWTESYTPFLCLNRMGLLLDYPIYLY